MRLLIAVGRASALDPQSSTIHLARAALRRGVDVFLVDEMDFSVVGGAATARASRFTADVEPAAFVAALLARQAPRQQIEVADLDAMLLRVSDIEPTLLAFASLAEARGVPVVNSPAGILAVGHKGWLAAQRDVPIPETLVTARVGDAHAFVDDLPDGVVIKPARGRGGRGVARVHAGDDRGLDRAFEAAARLGDGYVVIQRYLREADDGEMRLVWMDGRVLGGYLRRRPPGGFAHNLAQGGVASAVDIGVREQSIVERLGPALAAAGVRLAGIDLIGGFVTEVNAINPGGAFHADRLQGTRLADEMVARLLDGPQEGAWVRRGR